MPFMFRECVESYGVRLFSFENKLRPTRCFKIGVCFEVE